MTDAERAIAADASKGIEHGAVLLEEIRIDEDQRRSELPTTCARRSSRSRRA